MSEPDQDVPDIFITGSEAPPGTGLLRAVREQGAAARRHGRRRIRGLVAAVAALAAAGVTAALFTASASQAPSPLAVVTSAVAKTSVVSYNFSLVTTVQFAGREFRSDAVTGAADPRRELGAELLTAHGVQVPSATAQIRFIGKYAYTSVSPGSGLGTIGKPWNKALIPPTGSSILPLGELYGFSTEQLVTPAELLGVLRSAATVRDEGPTSGPGWTGTRYALTARLSAGQSVSGTVFVDQQGRVRRLVTTTTQGTKLTTVRDLTFGAFGAQVQVIPPSASQVKYTGGRPYWGFFF